MSSVRPLIAVISLRAGEPQRNLRRITVAIHAPIHRGRKPPVTSTRPADAIAARKLNLFEYLELRVLLSSAATPKSIASLDSALHNPNTMYASVGTSINTTDDDGLTIAYVPPTKTLANLDGLLSRPNPDADPLTVARTFLSHHAIDLGLSSADVSSAIVTDQYTDSGTGETHIYLRQTLNGLPVIGAELSINLTSENRVINVNSRFLANLAKTSAGATDAAPVAELSADQALTHAGRALGLTFKNNPGVKVSNGNTTLTSPEASLDPIPASLEYVATANGIELSWRLVLRLPHHNNDWYDIAVNGRSGKVNFADNWTDHLAQYNVFPIPTKAPNDGSRQIVADPSDALASPFGWHDTNGAAGAEFTDTRGNNVSAQDDTDANNTGGNHPDGGASLNFDFPLDLTQAPSTYQSAAITNLFYWVNILHDVHYQYGFTEAAGNFQVNNYGKGGAGNDSVQADAQDGSGTNNANFSTPPDGSSGQMQI